jgi:hypothetical protein
VFSQQDSNSSINTAVKMVANFHLTTSMAAASFGDMDVKITRPSL